MEYRSLDTVTKAYELRDVEMSKQAHDDFLYPKADHIEHHKTGGEFLKSAVFGGVDAIVTVYSVVAGSAGANLDVLVILILGLSSMLGDSIAMAFGDYLSTKSEIEYNKAERQRETWEVENDPEGEKLEMLEIYKNRGLSHDDATIMCETISKSKEAWVEIMMVEELGIVEGNESPVKNGIVTFLSFNFFGIFPLIPYIFSKVLGGNNNLLLGVSTFLSVGALVALGVVRASFTLKNWYISAFETLSVGVIASLVAFLVGYILEPLAD